MLLDDEFPPLECCCWACWAWSDIIAAVGTDDWVICKFRMQLGEMGGILGNCEGLPRAGLLCPLPSLLGDDGTSCLSTVKLEKFNRESLSESKREKIYILNFTHFSQFSSSHTHLLYWLLFINSALKSKSNSSGHWIRPETAPRTRIEKNTRKIQHSQKKRIHNNVRRLRSEWSHEKKIVAQNLSDRENSVQSNLNEADLSVWAALHCIRVSGEFGASTTDGDYFVATMLQSRERRGKNCNFSARVCIIIN